MPTQTSGFFGSRAPGSKPSTAIGFIDVGGEQFHAAAVALIDSWQSAPHARDATRTKILIRFHQYFPKYVTSQEYLSATILINNARKSEIVECMAYTLRQLTIDELYSNPLEYREVFLGVNADTAKAYWRDPRIKLPISALNALSQVLHANMVLSFKEPDKELRRRKIYVSHEASALNLEIQIQNDHCLPGVKHKADFAYVGQLAVMPPKPVENVDEQVGTLADIITLINDDNKELTQAFTKECKTMLSMVNAGEITRKQLMESYTTFLPRQSDNAAYIINLAQSQKAVTGAPLASNQWITESLVHSLAAWMCTGLVESDKFYRRLESRGPNMAIGA